MREWPHELKERENLPKNYQKFARLAKQLPKFQQKARYRLNTKFSKETLNFRRLI